MSLSDSRDYALSVVRQETPACLYVRQACQRFLDDLDDPPNGYSMDEDKAARACKFISLLPHIKGEWAREGRRIDLEPWQKFILTNVFGWVDHRGRRRYKTVYIEVPRKNAKSTLSSGVGLYCEVADDEEGAEVYSAATTREQAQIVWRDAKRMVDRSQGLRGRFGVQTSAHSIYVDHTASVFRPLSRDQGGNLDGLNVHCAIVDELHAHKTRDVYDVLETGTGSRSQPLIWMITTAGFNRAGICYEQRSYVLKILSGAIKDPEYFGIVYTVDPEDLEDEERLLTDPYVWRKANPNWGVSVNPEDVERKARKAFQVPSSRANFLTKHLDVWVNADTAWMDMIAWESCGDVSLDMSQFRGESCWVAADLASKIDIASIAYVFEREGHYYAFVRHYLNEEAAEEGKNSQYSGWARMGRLILTPGNVTDYQWIEDDLRTAASDHRIAEAGFDPWQAEALRQRLSDDGMQTIELRQTVANLSEPMKQLQALVLQRRFHFDGCPVLTWMASNVVARLDEKDNIYPRKEFAENKIDGIVALIMAMSLALAHQKGPSVYEQRGLVAL